MGYNLDQIPISDKLDQVVETNLQKLYKEKKIRRNRKIFIGMGSIAAVFACVIFIGLSNPAFASQIPLVGHVFEQIQMKVMFSGKYDKYADKLSNQDKQQKLYTETKGDMTVTLSEIYCNGESMNIATELKSKKGFTKNMQDSEHINFLDEIKFSFLDDQVKYITYLDGNFTDDHTWLGVMRIDFNFDYNKVKIPDQFTMKLHMYWFDGPWDFILDVKRNDTDVKKIQLDVNKDGVGFKKIVKTPFELSVYPIAPESMDHYIPILLDADGLIMTKWSGNWTNVAIQGHDISKVDVYMFDAITWLDEVKCDYWKTPEGRKKGEKLRGKTFKQLCDEKSLYHKTVYFK